MSTDDRKLALFLRAETLRMENSFEDAIPIYEEILALDPADLGARKTLAELYLIFGDRAKGVRAYYELAQEHRRRGEPDKVESFLRKIKILDAGRAVDVTEKALGELAELEAAEGHEASAEDGRGRERADLFEDEGRAEVDLRAPLFGALPPDELRKVLRALQIVRARKGTVLFREGDLTRSLFIIGQGGVEIRARAAVALATEGEARPVAVLGVGELFGEFSFLTGAPRSATARVVSEEEALLYVLNREVLDTLSVGDSVLLKELDRYYRERALDLLFARSALFSGLPAEDRKRIATNFELVSHPAGAAIIEEGTSGDQFFLIKTGEVQIVRCGTGQQPLLLALLGPNQFFGEISFLMGKPRSASAITSSPAEILMVPGEALREIIAHYPSVKSHLEKARLRRAVDTARRLSAHPHG